MADDLAGWSDDALVAAAGEGVGSEPALRPRAQAELSRRLANEVRNLASETRSTARVMIGLTIAIVVLTVVLVGIGIGTVVE